MEKMDHFREFLGVKTIDVKDGYADVVVEFKDTGCGIPHEIINKIFDPFFSTKKVGMGTGLGLSICYAIVDMHHGRIDVESEQDKGTVFRVVFPAAKFKEVH